jgi:hypothetical protein
LSCRTFLPVNGEKEACRNLQHILQRWRLAKAAATALFSPFTGRRWRQPDEGQHGPPRLTRGIGAVLVQTRDGWATRFTMACAEFIEYPEDSRKLFLPIETVEGWGEVTASSASS